MPPKPNSDPLVALERKTTKDSITGCWLYGDKNIYVKVTVRFRRIYIHRLSASVYLGYDLSDLINDVLHKLECKNRNCWNPEHLYIGTHQENMQDKMVTGHGSYNQNVFKTHCLQGHEYNLENTRSSGGKRRCITCERELRKLRDDIRGYHV